MFLELQQDLRYAVRSLRRTPLFTTIAVLTLALGIGANVAIFSVVEAVLLRPLPWTDPARLVSVWDGSHSRAEFVGVRDRNRSLEAVAAYRDRVGISLGDERDAVRLPGAAVSADLFRVLGASPALGRGFAAGEDRPGVEPVVVVSDALWRSRFGADPTLLGRQLDLDGVQHTVIGVMPAEFWFPRREVQLWIPLVLDPGQAGVFWGQYGQFIVGRLAPGVTGSQARAEVRSIAEQLRLENPVWRPSEEHYLASIDVIPLERRLVDRSSRQLLLLLLGAVGLVLLIACANVANLLIARGVAREREFSLRTALGAGRSRLLRQLGTESLVLAAFGGAAGLGLALGLVRVLVAILPADTPRLAEVGVNPSVLAFTAAVALLAGVGFGVVPAFRLSRSDPGLALGDRSGGSSRHRTLAGALVVAEIALAVVIAIGAGLLLRSFGRILAIDPGFRTEQVVTAKVSPPRARWSGPGFGPQPVEIAERQRVFYQMLTERLEASPGITQAAVINQAPFEKTNESIAIWVDGFTTDRNKLEIWNLRKVSPGYFSTMRIRLISGRDVSDTDVAGGPLVAVIDQAAADKYYPGRDPIGARLSFPWPGWMTVVGVVANVANNDLTDRPEPTIYVPFPQYSQAEMTVVAVATGGVAGAVATIRAVVRELAPDVPVSDERTIEDRISESVAQPRFAAQLLFAFGVLALLLGAVGTYGLFAYRTQRRTRELAVRMALGARAGQVVWVVVREGAVLAGSGVALGVLLAIGLGRVLDGMLFGVASVDLVTFGAVATLLLATALLATYLPARRATRVDPVTVIRDS